MYSEKINYNIIDNLPQKKIDNLDVQLINQMIEGYDTLQNTLDNIDLTNKYNLDTNKDKDKDNTISIKKLDKKNDYIALFDDSGYNSDNDVYFDLNNKSDNKSTISNNINLNAITNFYVGSLTVVGLFIFYRLIQRTK
jgi:hypothetical protein